MDRKNRPISREKNLTEGSDHVHKRGAGLNGGGGMNVDLGGGSGRGPERSGGGGFSKLIIIAVIVLLGGGGGLGSLLGGFLGGDASSTGTYDTYGSDTNTSYSSQSQTSGSNTVQSSSMDELFGSLFGSQSSSSASGSGWSSSSGSPILSTSSSAADTSVAPEAREKFTKLRGNGQDKVTLMVFMCGTDLESRSGMATADMQEMLNAGVGDNVNLLVYTGGCSRWKNNVVSSNTNQIYQVTSKGLNILEKDLGKRAMTDPDTLSWFIRYGARNFPADRYQLIFWDHGGGSISGYGYDETDSRAGSMTIDKISKALADGGVKFDFVGFDACLMATLETDMAVEPYADYMIASEETEPGVGWYYTNWLAKLSGNTSIPTVELGQKIVDDFVSVCAQRVPNSQTTLSVVDLAELKGTVPDKFKQFSKATTNLIQNNQYQAVSSARSNTKEFGKTQKIDQIDLIHLTEQLGTTEAKNLAEALRGAVKYNRTSSNIGHANGISIYFPYGRTSSVKKMANMYEEIGLDDSYAKCIQSFTSVETSGQAAAGGYTGQIDSMFGSIGSSGGSYTSSGTLSGADMATLLAQMLGARSMPELGIEEDEMNFLDEETLKNTQDYLTENQFDKTALKWTDKDGQKVLILPDEQWDLIQKVELNVFVDDGEGYIDLGMDNVFEFDEDGDLICQYDQSWIAINNKIVPYYLLSAEGDRDGYVVIGRVPAMLNGERVNLMLHFTNEYPKGIVTGAVLDYDEDSQTATQAKGEIEIKDGDVINYVCDYYDYDKNYIDSYLFGEPMTVSGEMKISNIKMDNKDYIAAFRLTDLYNNHFWTPSIQ